MPPRPAAWKSQTTCRPALTRSPVPPASSRLTTDQARMTSPRRSTRITGRHRYHEAVRPCAPHHYSPPRSSAARGSRFRGQPRATTAPLAARERGTTRSHVPHQSPGQARATSMPETTWPISRHPPGSSRAGPPDPVSISSKWFRHVISRSLTLAFLTHTGRAQRRAVSATLTTTAPDRSSLRWFATSPCRTIAEDHQPNRPAPPSPMQHRIKQSDLLHRTSLLRSVFTRGPATFRSLARPSVSPAVHAIFVAPAATRIWFLLRAPAGSEQKWTPGTAPVAWWPVVRGSSSQPAPGGRSAIAQGTSGRLDPQVGGAVDVQNRAACHSGLSRGQKHDCCGHLFGSGDAAERAFRAPSRAALASEVLGGHVCLDESWRD